MPKQTNPTRKRKNNAAKIDLANLTPIAKADRENTKIILRFILEKITYPNKINEKKPGWDALSKTLGLLTKKNKTFRLTSFTSDQRHLERRNKQRILDFIERNSELKNALETECTEVFNEFKNNVQKDLWNGTSLIAGATTFTAALWSTNELKERDIAVYPILQELIKPSNSKSMNEIDLALAEISGKQVTTISRCLKHTVAKDRVISFPKTQLTSLKILLENNGWNSSEKPAEYQLYKNFIAYLKKHHPDKLTETERMEIHSESLFVLSSQKNNKIESEAIQTEEIEKDICSDEEILCDSLNHQGKIEVNVESPTFSFYETELKAIIESDEEILSRSFKQNTMEAEKPPVLPMKFNHIPFIEYVLASPGELNQSIIDLSSDNFFKRDAGSLRDNASTLFYKTDMEKSKVNTAKKVDILFKGNGPK